MDIKLSRLLFFFGSWNHHGFVRTIDLEKDGHLFSGAVLPLLPILKPLILVVGVFFID